jgi:uncharacterized protein YcgI (DUF1989 family)
MLNFSIAGCPQAAVAPCVVAAMLMLEKSFAWHVLASHASCAIHDIITPACSPALMHVMQYGATNDTFTSNSSYSILLLTRYTSRKDKVTQTHL